MTDMVNGIKVEGLRELQDMFKMLPAKVGGRALKATLRNAARAMFEEVRRRVPQDTGALRDSLRIRVPRTPDPEEAFVYIQTPVFYARMLERGTRRMNARAFMGPAFDASVDEFIIAFKAEAEEQIDRAYKKLGDKVSGPTLGQVVANRKKVIERRRDLGRQKHEFVKKHFQDMESRLGRQAYHQITPEEMKKLRKHALHLARKQLGYYKPKQAAI